MKDKTRTQTILWALIILAALLRLIKLSAFNYNVDSYNFMLAARCLIETGHAHGPLGPYGDFFTVRGNWLYKWGFCLLLAPFSWTGKHQEMVCRAVVFVLSVGLVPLGFSLARRAGCSTRGALCASLLLAGSYQSIKLSSEIMSDTLAVALILWGLSLLLASERGSPWRIVGSALCLAAGIVTRSEYILLIPGWGIYCLTSRPLRKAWPQLAVASLAGGLLLAGVFGWAAWDLHDAVIEKAPIVTHGKAVWRAIDPLRCLSNLSKYAVSEPSLVLLAGIGFLHCLWVKRRIAVLALFLLIPLIVTYGSFHNQQIRYYFHLTPGLFLLAAKGLKRWMGDDLGSGDRTSAFRIRSAWAIVGIAVAVQAGVHLSKGRSAPGFEKEEGLHMVRLIEEGALPREAILLDRNWKCSHFYTGLSCRKFRFFSPWVTDLSNLPEDLSFVVVLNDYLRHVSPGVQSTLEESPLFRKIASFEVAATQQPWYHFTSPLTELYMTDRRGILELRRRLTESSGP